MTVKLVTLMLGIGMMLNHLPDAFATATTFAGNYLAVDQQSASCADRS